MASTSALEKRLASRVKLRDASFITRMADIAEGLDDVIRLGRGDPDFATPAHIVKAGQEALAAGATHYTHPLGIPALRQAIADNIETYGGARYELDEIVVTPGGQQAMFVIALSLLDRGDEILVPCPGYNPYHQAAEIADATLVRVPTTLATNFTLTAELVAQHITPKSKILVLINPNNPTGTVTPPDEIAKIAKLAIEHDLIVVSDEIYARLVYGNETVQPVAALPGMRDRTITLSGFSKAYAMTGWRIGYFAGPRALITAMAEIHHAFAISTASVSQHAALAALTGPQDCVEEMRLTYDQRRLALCAGLDQIGFTYAKPQGAFYVYADVSSTGLTASDFCERLLLEGRVMTYPGGISGDETDEFIRLSLTQPIARITEALRRMEKVVSGIKAERKASAA
ncbi:pyridoxal phosphate-dependent aminotransferase [Mesorhizobium sp. WSM4887]|uniref:pyridoxal phosphate-dependent aminotransferase n=1 Tax=Mesorhizobium sp. WSM4887 TaxID=3038543 RepID=UPI0024168A63|nr:pyridoxal phosphate-dependent aminotransferase [Mesorhizobium sp. WSM4887]MDG4889768.1 pyridoxal phosphate-dependent aminotransferase [Mesorhizobium sp. WSM4887]